MPFISMQKGVSPGIIVCKCDNFINNQSTQGAEICIDCVSEKETSLAVRSAFAEPHTVKQFLPLVNLMKYFRKQEVIKEISHAALIPVPRPTHKRIVCPCHFELLLIYEAKSKTKVLKYISP